MNAIEAKTILENDGFKVSICDTEGYLISVEATKDGFCETFYESNSKGHCSTYLCEFKNAESLIKYANKSIELAKKDTLPKGLQGERK